MYVCVSLSLYVCIYIYIYSYIYIYIIYVHIYIYIHITHTPKTTNIGGVRLLSPPRSVFGWPIPRPSSYFQEGNFLRIGGHPRGRGSARPRRPSRTAEPSSSCAAAKALGSVAFCMRIFWCWGRCIGMGVVPWLARSGRAPHARRPRVGSPGREGAGGDAASCDDAGDAVGDAVGDAAGDAVGDALRDALRDAGRRPPHRDGSTAGATVAGPAVGCTGKRETGDGRKGGTTLFARFRSRAMNLHLSRELTVEVRYGKKYKKHTNKHHNNTKRRKESLASSPPYSTGDFGNRIYQGQTNR